MCDCARCIGIYHLEANVAIIHLSLKSDTVLLKNVFCILYSGIRGAISGLRRGGSIVNLQSYFLLRLVLTILIYNNANRDLAEDKKESYALGFEEM